MQEALHGESATTGQLHVVVCEMAHDLAHALHIIGIARVVSAVLRDHTRIGGAIHIIRQTRERRNAAGDQHFLQTFRRSGQIIHRTKPAKALAKNAPRLVTNQRFANRLGIAHDVVGTKVLQVIALRFRRQVAQRLRCDRRRGTGAALVEQQDAKLL